MHYSVVLSFKHNYTINKIIMSTGTITQIIGPIVDVHFKDGVPSLLNALTVAKEGGEPVIEPENAQLDQSEERLIVD
jgi:F0F1-type ATP synthase beta subunit